MLKGHTSDLNIKGAFYHAVGDTIASIGVVSSGIIIIFTGLLIVDPAISVLIGIIILLGSARLIWESSHILLEGTPRHININQVSSAISTLDGVNSVHDLHVWSICSHINAASIHVLVDDIKVSEIEDISKIIKNRLEDFDIRHTTIEFETKDEGHLNELNHG
jgi:cobalt-zinc-cadmium efflux system protein